MEEEKGADGAEGTAILAGDFNALEAELHENLGDLALARRTVGGFDEDRFAGLDFAFVHTADRQAAQIFVIPE